jgi:hypothetical protein
MGLKNEEAIKLEIANEIKKLVLEDPSNKQE